MSSTSLPIDPARFALALKDLSLSSLHLRVLELRNTTAHLDYSNEQLRPFAEGRAATLSSSPTTNTGTVAGATAEAEIQPDQDCIDAITENEAVIARLQDRIRMIRAEVEGRGCSWAEFASKEELGDGEMGDREVELALGGGGLSSARSNGPFLNGVSATSTTTNGAGRDAGRGGATSAGNPWTDGTFQTGVVRNGEVHVNGAGNATAVNGGGRFTDEQLRQMMEARLAETEAEEDEDGGMHL